MALILPFALILAAIVLITIAVTGSTARQAISGQANTTSLHKTAGA